MQPLDFSLLSGHLPVSLATTAVHYFLVCCVANSNQTAAPVGEYDIGCSGGFVSCNNTIHAPKLWRSMNCRQKARHASLVTIFKAAEDCGRKIRKDG